MSSNEIIEEVEEIEEIEILDPKTFLFRSILPSLFKHGKISQKAFIPREKDKGKFSVFDSQRIDLKECFRVNKYILLRPSEGISRVSVGFVNSNGLKAITNPTFTVAVAEKDAETMVRIKTLNDSHAFIDMRGLSDDTLIAHSASLSKEANSISLYSISEFDEIPTVPPVVAVPETNLNL